MVSDMVTIGRLPGSAASMRAILSSGPEATGIPSETGRGSGKTKSPGDTCRVVGCADVEIKIGAIESRDGRIPRLSTTEASTTESAVATILPTESASLGSDVENQPDLAADRAEVKTPPTSRTPDSTLLRAPLVPANEALMPVPAFVLGRDVQTPTPMPLSTTTSVSEIGSQPQ